MNSKVNHQNINADSGDDEYYTSTIIIEAARATMGSIDLDPASSDKANRTVKADNYWTKDGDALSFHTWRYFNMDREDFDMRRAGNVWMNHPFGKGEKACKKKCIKKICRERGHHIDQDIPGNNEWINKLLTEYKKGNIKQACCITFASTSESWFKRLMQYPQCYLQPRTNYLTPDGKIKQGVTKGSCVTYLGSHVDRFYRNFKHIGTVMVNYEYLGENRQ